MRDESTLPVCVEGLFEAAPIPLAIFDASLRCAYANAAFVARVCGSPHGRTAGEMTPALRPLDSILGDALHDGVAREDLRVHLGGHDERRASLVFVFPVAFGDGAGVALGIVAPPAHRAPTALPLDGRRVLVVDDEPDARELLAVVVASAGAVVETAASAAEGLEAIERFRPEVLLSDVGMPHEDGLSLMRNVRRLAPERQPRAAIAVTAFTRPEDQRATRAAGFDHHVGKPVEPDRLVHLVCRSLARESRV